MSNTAVSVRISALSDKNQNLTRTGLKRLFCDSGFKSPMGHSLSYKIIIDFLVTPAKKRSYPRVKNGLLRFCFYICTIREIVPSLMIYYPDEG